MTRGAETILEQMERELTPPPEWKLPDRMLYHYTDAFGLDGILRSGCLRATHYRYLNDTRELVEGREVVDQAAADIEAGAEYSEVQRALSKEFRRAFHLPKVNAVLRDTFVAALSVKPDDLGQWRAYGARGAGYCIGIQFVQGPVPAAADGDTLRVMLLPCEYDRDAARGRIRGVLEKLFQGVERYVRAYGQEIEPMRLASRGAVVALTAITPLWMGIKDASYRDEAEWRMVAAPGVATRAGAIKVRPTEAHGLVPYVEVPLNRGADGKVLRPAALDEVIVGPTRHRQDGRVAVSLLLESVGYDREHAERIVKASEIPYRG